MIRMLASKLSLLGTLFLATNLNVFFAELVASIVVVHEGSVGALLQQGLNVLLAEAVGDAGRVTALASVHALQHSLENKLLLLVR